MGREVGEGFRMGSTCTPMVDSSQCMAKPIQCCKVKLKKKNWGFSFSCLQTFSISHLPFRHKERAASSVN